MMINKFCQALNELRAKSSHELKEVGDQCRLRSHAHWCRLTFLSYVTRSCER